jgi:hypothetical protein
MDREWRTLSIPIRDRVIVHLAKHMTVERIGQLQLEEVASVDPKTKYVEARGCIPLDTKGRSIIPPDALSRDLEDYLNAQPPGRPFLDFRPEIGMFLFPSPRTGSALSTWALRRIIQGRSRRHKPGPPAREAKTSHVATAEPGYLDLPVGFVYHTKTTVRYQAVNDDVIPPDLRMDGFILLLGLRVTTEAGLLSLLRRLDRCHHRPESFTLAAGGMYCAPDDISHDDNTDTDADFRPVDLTLPHGLHTNWHHHLTHRPLLRAEAEATLMYTYCVLGSLDVRLGHRSLTRDLAALPYQLFLNKVPPLLVSIWTISQASDGSGRPIAERRLRRALRLAFDDDAFEPQSIRHLIMKYSTTSATDDPEPGTERHGPSDTRDPGAVPTDLPVVSE